jgi:hypothetical protein
MTMTRYDHVAEFTGVKMQSFEDMHEDEVWKMKGLVSRYVEAANAMKTQLEAVGAGIPLDITTGVGVVPFAPQLKYTLGLTKTGFPVLPRPMNTHGWSKDDWEKLQMEFMCSHYSEWPVKIGA